MMRSLGTPSAAKVLAVSSLAILSIRCGGGGSDSPTAVRLPSCQLNNTADVTFGNTSASQTMNVQVAGGVLIATLGPGQTYTQTFSVATFTFQFIDRATRKRACTDTTMTLGTCTTRSLSCKGTSGGGGGGGGQTYGTGSAGTPSSCHNAGMGYCVYGAGGFCAPYGSICCGYKNYCPLFNDVVLGTAYNCQHGAPDLPWMCYQRTWLNDYIHVASCLDARSYSCDQRPQ